MNASTISNPSPELLSARLWRESAYVVAGRFLGIGLGCAISILLARTLDKADFGRYSLLLTTTVIFSTVARFGFDRLLMCHLAELEVGSNQTAIISLVRNVARIVLVTTVFSAIGMGIFLVVFSPIVDSQHASFLIVTTIMAMGLMTVLYLIAESFRGYHDLKRATLYDANRSGPLVCLVFLLLLLTGLGTTKVTLPYVMFLFLIAQLLILILAGLDFFRSLKMRNPPNNNARVVVDDRESPQGLSAVAELNAFQPRSLVWAASSIAVSQVLGNFISFGDTWIAGAAVSTADLGNWSAVAQLIQLVTTPLGMINLTIISAIPALFRRGKLDELQRILQTTATVATMVSLIPLTLLICFPAWVLSTVFGSQFVDAAMPLAIVSFGKLIFVWTGTCGYTLMLTGNQRIVLLNNAISCVVMVALGYSATISYGLTGLACVASGVTILSNIVNWLAVRASVGIWTHGTVTIVRTLRISSRTNLI